MTDARVASGIVQVAIVIDPTTVFARDAAEVVQVAVQIKRGTLLTQPTPLDRKQWVDAHERQYVTGMAENGEVD